MLANIYLHYVIDLWFDRKWRKHTTEGDAIIVRYADDVVIGLQHEQEAERLLRDLEERLARFGLELHPTKTRILEFGRHAKASRKARGLGKPETFDFLGRLPGHDALLRHDPERSLPDGMQTREETRNPYLAAR